MRAKLLLAGGGLEAEKSNKKELNDMAEPNDQRHTPHDTLPISEVLTVESLTREKESSLTEGRLMTRGRCSVPGLRAF